MPLAFDTTGLQRHDERTWFDPRTGDQVSLTYFDLEPDLPASLEELPLLRQRLAHVLAEAGTLVEAHVVTIDSVPALYQVVKLPIPGRQTGLMFVAALTVPKATGSVVLQVLCQEGSTSGIRESAVVAQLGFENCFPPHPYAPGLHGVLPWNAADDQRWDSQFPDHPLSRARAWAHRTIRTARVDPNFARLPPFRPQTVTAPHAFDTGHSTPPGHAAPEPFTRRFAPPPEPLADSDHLTPPEPDPFGGPADARRFTTPPESLGAGVTSAFTVPTFGGPASPPEPQPYGDPPDARHLAPQEAFGTPSEPATDPQHLPTPEPFGAPTDSPRFTAPDASGEGSEHPTPATPRTFGGPADSHHFTAPDVFGAPPQPQALDPDPQHLTPPDPFGAPSEPGASGPQHPTTPEPQPFDSSADSPRFTVPDTLDTPPEPRALDSDAPHLTPAAPQSFGDPTDSQRFTAPDPFDTPPEPPTPGANPQHLTPPEPQTFEPQALGAGPGFSPPEPHVTEPSPPEPRSFTEPRPPRPSPAPEETEPPRKPRPFPEPQGFEPPREPLPHPAPEDATPDPEPFAAPPEPFDVNSAFTEPQPPPPPAASDVLHTVLVGIPIGDYLPLWQRDGQEDRVTFWRMSDPDAVRARLGTGVESRSAVGTGRYREAAMFSPERQMLFLMDRFRDDSGNLGGTSEQLFPATEEEAYRAADDKALSGLYSWLGEVMLAAARRGEFVAVETGGWNVPVNPVVLVMLRNDGRNWHSVVETSPVPVGAPVWRDQQPVEGSTQVLASPATDQTLRASGLLTRFAINTWSMHPFQLGISFGPNPTLEDR